MKEVKTYNIGIERLDKDGRPVEHIDYWEEYDLQTALAIYDNIEIEKGKSAKYLIAQNWEDEEVILLSTGYKDEK